MDINSLIDLNRFRSAPPLNKIQKKQLLEEIDSEISSSDWITVGIMACHDFEAVNALKSISIKYPSKKFIGLDELKASGNVFLKGNEKTGNVFIRSESGLGEGILLTCQYEEKSSNSITFGPFPLNFFKN